LNRFGARAVWTAVLVIEHVFDRKGASGRHGADLRHSMGDQDVGQESRRRSGKRSFVAQ